MVDVEHCFVHSMMHAIHLMLSKCDPLRAYITDTSNIINLLSSILLLNDVFLQQCLQLGLGLISLLDQLLLPFIFQKLFILLPVYSSEILAR